MQTIAKPWAQALAPPSLTLDYAKLSSPCFRWWRRLMMEWLLRVLFGAWWYGRDGQTNVADASDKYLVPVLLLIGLGLLGLLAFLAFR